MVALLSRPCYSVQSSELCEGVVGGRGSLLSHSAVSQGIIITHDDSLIGRADSRLHIFMHFYRDAMGRLIPRRVQCLRDRSSRQTSVGLLVGTSLGSGSFQLFLLPSAKGTRTLTRYLAMCITLARTVAKPQEGRAWSITH